jgi:hypothetical protein
MFASLAPSLAASLTAVPIQSNRIHADMASMSVTRKLRTLLTHLADCLHASLLACSRSAYMPADDDPACMVRD